jgi:hypothetical protein
MNDTAAPPVDEFYRINVPNPLSELTLGKSESGYVGLHFRTDTHADSAKLSFGKPTDLESELSVGARPDGFTGFLARVGSGSAFVGAGGGLFGQSTLQQFGITASAVSLGIVGITAVTGLVERLMFATEESTLKWILTVLKTGLAGNTISSAINAKGTYNGPGNVGIYADQSASVVGTMGATMSSVVSTVVSGGITAALTGLISSTVGNGLFSNMTGILNATVNGRVAQLVGGARTRVAARHGEVLLEGKAILVGNPGDKDGLARSRGFAPQKQEATKEVRVESDEEILLAVGRVHGGNDVASRIEVTPTAVRLEATNGDSDGSCASVVGLNQHHAHIVTSGGALAVFGDSGITLAFAATGDVESQLGGMQREFARYAEDLEPKPMDLTKAAAEDLALGAAVGAVVGPVIAMRSVEGAGKATDAGAVAGGVLGGGLLGGAVVGGLSTLAAIQVAKAIAESKRVAALKKAAFATHVTNLKAARDNERDGYPSLASKSKVKFEILEDCIVLGVGKNTLTLDEKGVTIACDEPGAKLIAPGVEAPEGGVVEFG